jgi:hypothetical protein
MFCAAGARLRALSVFLSFVAIKPDYHGARGRGQKVLAPEGERDRAIIKPADCKRRTIGKHEGFRRFIDPEAQVLFDARRSTSSWRVYDHDFFC